MDLNAYQEDLKTRNANRGQWWSNFVPLFRGPTCVPWETSYDTNTTESNPGRVWVMIEDDLGPLKAASQRALDRLRQAEEEQ
ncbi:MAG: hypothetical protein JWQ49_3332 [Edaphobacter sp.]|nr:hypothetical protein [Edaphobacter sp.]